MLLLRESAGGLPRHVGNGIDAHRSAETLVQGREDPMTPIAKVLIVEDSRLFRHVFRQMLQARFPALEIHEAVDGKEALEIVKGAPPDLVFMDIQLPGVNGLEVMRMIKAQHPQITGVIFTGYDAEYRDAASKDADYFLSKRSTSEEVFSMIENILKAKV